MQDALTVLWKEARELIAALWGQGRVKAVLQLFSMPLLGILLALQDGETVLRQPLVSVIPVLLASSLASAMCADSFAGERERHTLETLLASRLSENAILFGKLAAVVLYAWGNALLYLAAVWAAANIVHRGSGIQLYDPLVGTIGVVGSLISSLLAGALGVLVSIRADSTKQAAQTIGMGFLLLTLPVILVGTLLPDPWEDWILRHLLTLDPKLLIAGAAVGAVALSVVLLAIARTRFRRSRLLVR